MIHDQQALLYAADEPRSSVFVSPSSDKIRTPAEYLIRNGDPDTGGHQVDIPATAASATAITSAGSSVRTVPMFSCRTKLVSGGMSPLYETLPPEHIRLLSVKGTKAVEIAECPFLELAIDCSLQVVSLADVRNGDASYQALSYVWGSRSCPRPVLCNDEVKLVTSNLYHALWYLARGSEELPLRLWVDALCINQDDVLDKNQQVPMMGKIYQLSVNAIIWLGAGIEQANVELNEFWERLSTPSSHKPSIQANASADDNTISVDAVYAGQLYLSRCEWLRRAWTLQEIILAPNAHVMRGLHRISWDTLDWYARISPEEYINRDKTKFYKTPPITIEIGLGSFFGRLDAIADLRENHPMSMRRLLGYSWDRSSTDPRDRVYSLLGLYGGSWRFDIDYSLNSRLTRGQLFFTLAVEAECVHSPLAFGCEDDEILTRSSSPQEPGIVRGISWIPEWTTFSPKEWQRMFYWKKDVPSFSLRRLHPSFALNFALTHDRLTASGAVINSTFELWIKENDKTHRMLVSELRPMKCLQDLASDSKPVVNEPPYDRHFGRESYTPAFQDASVIFHRMWDHVLGDCPCPRPTSQLLEITKWKKAREERKFIIEWKQTGEREKGRSISWDCVIFGERSPLVLEPHYNAATGKVACILQRRRPHKRYAEVIDEFYGPPAQLDYDSMEEPRSYPDIRVPEGKTPADIPGKLGLPFYWLPTHFPLIGSTQGWERFNSQTEV